MIDLNDIDTVEHVSNTNDIKNDNSFINMDEFIIENSRIKEQYIKFENLGINKIDSIDNEQVRILIFKELIWYVHNNYFPIPNYEDIFISSLKCDEMGKLIYEFIVIDLYNMIIPNFFTLNKIIGISDVDKFITLNLKNDLMQFKNELIKSINEIINKLKNVENLDKDLKSNDNFQQIINKLIKYIQIINFADITLFHSFIRMYIMINEEDLYKKII